MPKSAKLDSKVAINRIKIESLPSTVFSGTEPVIPYGPDNLYVNRMIGAIKGSPTAKGCVKRLSEFVFGKGLTFGGDIVVNRDGETFNRVLSQAIKNYAEMNGFCLHFNFNVLGDITEIFAIDTKYVRKTKDLTKVLFGIWDNGSYYNKGYITVDLYDPTTVKKRIREEGIRKYNGQVLYFAKDYDIYPDSPLDSASASASFEKQVQIYQNASVNNGFSGSGVLKVPTNAQGEKSDINIEVARDNIEALTGAEHAGSVIVVPIRVDMDGKSQNTTLYEPFTPPNVDSMFINQNAKAKENILTVYTMPQILLGVPNDGMFNTASFNDAFDYKNADTEGDRKIIEEVFQTVVDNSIFPIPKIEIEPLEMKSSQKEVEADDINIEL